MARHRRRFLDFSFWGIFYLFPSAYLRPCYHALRTPIPQGGTTLFALSGRSQPDNPSYFAAPGDPEACVDPERAIVAPQGQTLRAWRDVRHEVLCRGAPVLSRRANGMPHQRVHMFVCVTVNASVVR